MSESSSFVVCPLAVLLIVLAALAIGYLTIFPASSKPAKSSFGKRSEHRSPSIDDELKQLKRKIDR